MDSDRCFFLSFVFYLNGRRSPFLINTSSMALSAKGLNGRGSIFENKYSSSISSATVMSDRGSVKRVMGVLRLSCCQKMFQRECIYSLLLRLKEVSSLGFTKI